MSWFGKMVGGTVGLMIGGPIGAIAGGAIGHHMFDKKGSAATRQRLQRQARSASWQSTSTGRTEWTRTGTGGNRTDWTRTGSSSGGSYGSTRSRDDVEVRQAAFFVALFSILGKLAKADGRITKEEGDAVVRFLDRMKVTGDQRQFAVRVFNEAKNSRFSAEDFARQFVDLTRGQRDLRESLIDMLFETAAADGSVDPEEENIIRSVARVFDMPQSQVEAMKARYVADKDQAYAALGLSTDAADEEVKETYRRLVQEYHPDRIISQGMPQEFVQYATERFQEIQTAWEVIRKERNL